MIAGIGVDLCSLARLQRALLRAPRLRQRLFTPEEQTLALPSLAARFALKEAAAKALGAPPGWSFLDATVEGRPPELRLSGKLAAAAAARGVQHTWVSLTHEPGPAGGYAVAMVVLER